MLGVWRGHTFRDMGGAVWGVEGVIHFEIWAVLFRDMGGAVLGGGGGDTVHTVGVLFIARFSERYDIFDTLYLFTRIRKRHFFFLLC